MSLFETARNAVFSRALRLAVGLGGKPSPQQDETVEIPSRDAGRTIRIHVYRNTKHEAGTGPVLVNFHGSGFVLPLHGSDDEFCRRIRDETDYTVLDCPYRLAPEHPFPAGPDDAQDIIKWLKQQKYDLGRFAISGFSAGGNLALGLFHDVLDSTSCQRAILFYPATNLSVAPESKKAPDTTGRDVLPPWIANSFNSCYLPPGIDRSQPRASPSFIDISRFPSSMLFVTCAYDNLAPEAEELAGRIAKTEGKNVKVQRVERCAHAWEKNAKPGSWEEEQKNAAYASAVELLRS